MIWIKRIISTAFATFGAIMFIDVLPVPANMVIVMLLLYLVFMQGEE